MKIQSWRELLKQIVDTPQDKQHIVVTLHISPITLQRWINGESQPRIENLRLLIEAIPYEHRTLFSQLIAQEYPSLATGDTAARPVEPELPAAFYARVLSIYAYTSPSLYPQTIFPLILQQAIEQLDVDQRGMSVSIALCMPPLHKTVVRSLRETTGIGTAPWNRNLEQETVFLGIESLAGAAVSASRLTHARSRDEKQLHLFSVQWMKHEQSAVACPITRQARIAGCLLVASAVPNYFTPSHLTLIEAYANLLSLAFEREQFYDSQQIQLQLLPEYKVQQRYLQNFQSRVSQKVAEATQQHQFLRIHDAYTFVWQEIEEELTRFKPSTDTSP